MRSYSCASGAPSPGPAYGTDTARRRSQFSAYSFASCGSLITSRFSAFLDCAEAVKLNEPVIAVASSITMTLLCAIDTRTSTHAGTPAFVR